MRVQRRTLIISIFTLLISLLLLNGRTAESKSVGLYPDLVNVVPHQLELVNQQQKTILRFSNAVANVGDGPLQLRPDQPLNTANTANPVNVIQDILDSNGNVVSSTVVSKFLFAPDEKKWEALDVAVYTIRQGSLTGPMVASTTKMACCFIDWYNLTGNAPTTQRIYWDCWTMQGLSVGWADQYHAANNGQDLDMTGLPPGLYYLTSTANPSNLYLEKDYTNDMAWVSFNLVYDSTGNAKIVLVDHSPCSTPGLCGTNAPNR